MITHPLLERVRVRSHAITNGAGLFSSLSGLRELEIDTAGISVFQQFFYYCRSLTTIPALDTSGGVTFTNMLHGCSSLQTIPHLDTSRGVDFSGMFAWLRDYGGKLCQMPLLDTSNGVSFSQMFMGCSLRSIPALDLRRLREGIAFSYSHALAFIDVRGLGEGLDPNSTSQLWVGLEGTGLGAAALNAFYANLAPVNNRGTILLSNTPGVLEAGHQPQLASSKGWTLIY